ncbi:alpha/beta fold hydrolase [Maribacter sp. 2307ULW6-5]|uniref:alpha/beta fold hydrolase n=1 Tax=Maribacter sp. 2307ULW6-5 TaxID=3386275 RepID=UPI0039BC7E5A
MKHPLLHSKILGAGTPLCILHGFLGMADNWKTLGNAYAEQGFQVHLLDQRNHGRSFHHQDFNYGLMAMDLLHYLEEHQMAKTHIIGHSMGGKTAMQFACAHPERTHKLVVADIAPKYYPPHHQDIINALNGMDLDAASSRSEADAQLKKGIAQAGIRQFLLKNLYWTPHKKLAFRFNLPVLNGKMAEIGENIGSTEQFHGPTLFLRGERSEYVTDADEQDILRHFPAAKIETVPRAGHWLHAENPKDFFDRSMAFLKP